MHKKTVYNIKEFFESYELLDRLSVTSDEVPAIKVNVYFNEKKEVLNVKIVERLVRSSKRRKSLQKMGFDIGDNLFCEFRLNSNKAKFTFKLNRDYLDRFHSEIKFLMQKKYKCSYFGTNVYVESYEPRLEDVMNIFAAFESICRKDK